MSNRRAVAVVAAVVLAVGVVLAFLPLSVGSGSGEVGCGSVYDPRPAEAHVRDLVDRPVFGSYTAACEEEVSDRRWVAYSIGGAGALALLFVWLTGQHRTRWDVEEDAAGERAP